jgi:hypothetical protein
MDKIKDLEVRRLFQEYQYLLTDIEYKDELISKHKSDFLKESQIEQENNNPESQQNQEKKEKDIIEVDEETKSNIKKIYRDIVKLTHPDKVDSEYLNKLYIEATDSVRVNDVYALYKICIELNINFEIGEGEKNAISNGISILKKKAEAIENSYIWTWINSKTEEEKRDISNRFKEHCRIKLK